MPLHDLAQAVPGLVVAVLLPGFALATLLAPRWRWWERLAGAPGLSAGFFGVLGLGMRLVHIPFEPLTVLPCIALLAAAAVVRRRRSGAGAARELPWWIPVPALIAGGVGAAMFAWALSSQVLPPDWDPRVHGALAAAIARTHDVLPLFPIPLQGTSFTYARPGFEAMAAVVSWIGGPSPAEAMTPIIALVLIVLPLGLTLLALEATGSIALALVVPLVAAGMAFPSIQAIVGRFPQVVDSTLVVPLIVAAMRLLRGRQQVDNALLLVAATASIWVVHGLEVLTALVVGGVLVAATAVVALRQSGWIALLRIAAAGLAVGAGVALVTVLTRRPHVPPPTVVEASAAAVQQPPSPLHLHVLFQLVAQTDFVSPLAIALYCIGVIALVIQRRMLWLLVANVVVVMALADSLYWRHLGSIWRSYIFPFGDEDRLVGLLYWILPLIFGAGLLAVAALMRRLARDRRIALGATISAAAVALVVFLARGPLDRRYMSLFGAPTVNVPPLGVFDALARLAPWRVELAVALASVVLAWIILWARARPPAALRARLRLPGGFDAASAAVAVLALMSLAVGARSEMARYNQAIVNRATATPADVAVLNSMAARLPRGALVLTDGLNDAGIWVSALTTLQPLIPLGSEGGALGEPLVADIARACDDPAAAEAALRQVDAIFVGSHHLVGSHDQWDVRCVAALPDVRVIAMAPWQGTEAAAFAVIH